MGLSQYGMVFYSSRPMATAAATVGTDPGAKSNRLIIRRGSSERHAPTRVSVTISPGQVSVGVDDLPPLQGPWSLARPHTGFFVRHSRVPGRRNTVAASLDASPSPTSPTGPQSLHLRRMRCFRQLITGGWRCI